MDVHYDFINVMSCSQGENRLYEFLVIRDPNLYLAKKKLDVRYDFINGMSWSRGANTHNFKFKRTPKREN
ncbi:hypothetical protein H5410_039833 [Solanum commersonii]|uniref:Uncharacterized protein n=1 Tax=Solanum commersonii TaxID=4109 RepID=A0A9J5XPA3_SOLCO|nr:hypothetical protein H5410_039833 [Solanum commersonii]